VGVLVVSGAQLFVLTTRTAEVFAWTIAAGSTATIMGGVYWTACVLSFPSWRRRAWVRARVGIPAVVVFLWATLLSTLIHLDKLHLSASGSARLAAWAWLLVYVLDPLLMTWAWVKQQRVKGLDAPPAGDLSLAYRLLLLGSGLSFGLLGLVMLGSPATVMAAAPLPLTPFTSRAIGSWVLGMGTVFATMAWENDMDRILPAAVASLVLVPLLLTGLMRYWEQFRWGAASAVYIGLITLVGLIGALGLQRPGRRDG